MSSRVIVNEYILSHINLIFFSIHVKSLGKFLGKNHFYVQIELLLLLLFVEHGENIDYIFIKL